MRSPGDSMFNEFEYHVPPPAEIKPYFTASPQDREGLIYTETCAILPTQGYIELALSCVRSPLGATYLFKFGQVLPY